jgi:hypothetical protein
MIVNLVMFFSVIVRILFVSKCPLLGGLFNKSLFEVKLIFFQINHRFGAG